jgi:hypothetical protein
MARKMVKLPEGAVMYIGNSKYVGEAPEIHVRAMEKGIEEAAKRNAQKEAQDTDAQKGGKPPTTRKKG